MQISFDEFIDNYKPFSYTSGLDDTYFLEPDTPFPIETLIDSKHLLTYITGEGDKIVQGYRTVNRYAFVITAKPVPDGLVVVMEVNE
jgi:hypothetical protein